MKRVAIQGFSGCFHEQAARMFYQQHEEESHDEPSDDGGEE